MATTIQSKTELDAFGFKGEPSISYLKSGKFIWHDKDHDGSEYNTTTGGEFITYDPTTTEYEFVLSAADSN
jgi:hypothetical protein